MKIAFGIITKDFLQSYTLDNFLDNAEKYGHKVDSVIVTYSRNMDIDVVEKLRERIDVHLVKINKSDELCLKLRRMRMSKESIKNLLNCEKVNEDGIVPYGTNRNATIMKAMILNIDVLIFVDTDVYPVCLVEEDGIIVKKEVDFVGNHLEYLLKDNVYATTSDYSGYYIIPEMHFDGMKDLFIGIQKETAYNFIKDSYNTHCLNLSNYGNRKPFESTKILGGNVAIKLKVFRKMVPFFSTSFEFNGKTYLTRGEDTLMGLEFAKLKNYKCIDIDLKIFHDTYNNYPEIPNVVLDEAIKDRFFYACMGWLGRNPFLNWIRYKDILARRMKQRNAIKNGSIAASKYFNDKRFLMLPEVLELSYDRLDIVISEYRELAKAWKEFIEKLD